MVHLRGDPSLAENHGNFTDDSDNVVCSGRFVWRGGRWISIAAPGSLLAEQSKGGGEGPLEILRDFSGEGLKFVRQAADEPIKERAKPFTLDKHLPRLKLWERYQ